MGEYYDGTKLISMKDVNGKDPAFFLCSGNRTGGKTVWFSRLLVNRWKKKGQKFGLLYRFNDDMSDVAETFFKDINALFFPGDEMESEIRAKGKYHELFYNGEPCGYSLAINNADWLKRKAHLFSDIENLFMDEFQSETNHYCPDEVTKFRSVITSVARGRGEHVRHVPVFLCSNTVTLLNPYYSAMGISDKLRADTKFLRGDGYVLENAFVESAATAIKESAYARAFIDDSYTAYAAENVYLNDNYAFVEQPKGRGKYSLTVKYMNKSYALYEYIDSGIIYVTDKVDLSFPRKIALTTDDMNINYLMLQKNAPLIIYLRELFAKGCFRFRNLESKQMCLKLLSFY